MYFPTLITYSQINVDCEVDGNIVPEQIVAL